MFTATAVCKLQGSQSGVRAGDTACWRYTLPSRERIVLRTQSSQAQIGLRLLLYRDASLSGDSYTLVGPMRSFREIQLSRSTVKLHSDQLPGQARNSARLMVRLQHRHYCIRNYLHVRRSPRHAQHFVQGSLCHRESTSRAEKRACRADYSGS